MWHLHACTTEKFISSTHYQLQLMTTGVEAPPTPPAFCKRSREVAWSPQSLRFRRLTQLGNVLACGIYNETHQLSINHEENAVEIPTKKSTTGFVAEGVSQTYIAKHRPMNSFLGMLHLVVDIDLLICKYVCIYRVLTRITC